MPTGRLPRIALATCSTLPEPDMDQAPSLAAFERLGSVAEPVPWDAPEADLSAFDAVCLRVLGKRRCGRKGKCACG